MKQFCLLFLLFFGMNALSAQFLESKKNLISSEGYFNFYYAEDQREIYLEVSELDKEFLYVHYLSSGLGSNDIGLDRGQIGDGVLVKFVKSGSQLLLIQTNQKFRANTDNELEKKSVEQAFVKSVLYGFSIKEKKGNSYIIDLTPFLLLDSHGIAQTLKRKKEGIYKLDKNRSTLWMKNTKAFPKNVEFEAFITFVGQPSGKNIRPVSPDPTALSFVQHLSFVKLPENNYQPRIFDTRCGSYPMEYMDYATPIWAPIKKRFITRHLLEKKHPNKEISEAKEPIIYYVDPSTPEPVRTALMEGASWWNEAFEAIGFKNAFQVKMLPKNADPLDLRYNVIQWVHRSTRGWSYGGTIIDPRTGEILKGHVSLGSLRIRQDFMIAQALMNRPFAERDDNDQPMLDMALARIRQLSAHEVGHTLGFAHNFAASTNNRASVMDYPYPTLTLKNGAVDFSNAYATGIGAWDKVTVAYSYSEFDKNTSEKEELNKILKEAFSKGYRYISDNDARPQGGAHGKAHLWDNGSIAYEELENILNIREKAIENFSEDNIRTGEPLTVLEDLFVPLYFLHRFQTEATVKMIGGLDYSYAVKGDKSEKVKYLPKQEQEKALQMVLKTLEAKLIAIPEEKLSLFPPRTLGYARTRESFKSRTGVSFDALGAAATASDMTLSLLLNPERANRLIQQKSIEIDNLGLQNVLNSLIRTTMAPIIETEYIEEVHRTIQFVTLHHLMNLAVHKKSIPQVKALVNKAIERLAINCEAKEDNQSLQLLREINEFKKHPEKFVFKQTSKIPDGSPIGSFQCYIAN